MERRGWRLVGRWMSAQRTGSMMSTMMMAMMSQPMNTYLVVLSAPVATNPNQMATTTKQCVSV